MSGTSRKRSRGEQQFDALVTRLNKPPRTDVKAVAVRMKSLGEIRQLAARALAAGGVLKSHSRVTWAIAGNCSDPFTTEYYGRTTAWERNLGRERGTRVMVVEIETRCRKCEKCLRAQQNLWRTRAIAEWNTAARTWMGTLTLSPDAHAAILFRARARLGEAKWHAMSADQQFLARADLIGEELTKLWKRIRKNSKLPSGALRYLRVFEKHPGAGPAHGLPHIHCLLHEVRSDQPVREKMLATQWKLGFSTWRLVTDPKGCRYVTDYVTKSAGLARVRASQHYGDGKTLSKHSFTKWKNVDI